MKVVIPSSDASPSIQYNNFNFTDYILAELQDNEGSFSTAITSHLQGTSLNIAQVTVNQVTETYVIMVSADLGFGHNWVQDGIFVSIINSERDWILQRLNNAHYNHDYQAQDVWYVDGSCGPRAGVTYIASNSDTHRHLNTMICEVYIWVLNHMDHAATQINAKLKHTSISVNSPSDIRVCAVFDNRIDACAQEMIQSRYICINRYDTDDIHGFNCHL